MHQELAVEHIGDREFKHNSSNLARGGMKNRKKVKMNKMKIEGEL